MQNPSGPRIDPFIALFAFIISIAAYFAADALVAALSGRGMQEWFLTLYIVRYSPLTYVVSNLLVTVFYFVGWYIALASFFRWRSRRKGES